MTTLTKVGNFILRSGTGNQSITGVGFTPKVVIFWSQYYSITDPIPADNNSDPGHQLMRFFGAASSSTARFCEISALNYHVNGAENGIQNDRCILWRNPYDGAYVMDADFSSMDSDGFTINVTRALPTTFNYSNVQINFMAIGGSSITAQAGTFLANTGDQGTTQTYSVGFQPKALIFVTGPQNDGTTSPDTGGALGLGFCVGTSASQQACCSYWETPEASRLTKNIEYQGACIPKIGYNGDFLDMLGTVTALGSTSFSVFYKCKSAATTCMVGYVALGGTATFSFGTITEPGSTGVQTISTPGVKPVAQFFMTSGNTSSGTTNYASVTTGFATLNANSNMSIAGTDNRGQELISHYVPDGNTTDTTMVGASSTSSGIGRCSSSATFNSQGAFQFDFSQSFTINWTTVSGSGIRYPYLVIGDVPLKTSRAMINVF